MKISIIIPVYNCPVVYLKQLVDSLSELDSTNFEVLIIDDGSDNKQLLCFYKSINKKIYRVIFCGNNYGVSHARNIGINESKGEYITFVDADDLIDAKLLSKILKFVFLDDIYFFKLKYTSDRNTCFSDDNLNVISYNKDIKDLYCYDFRNESPFDGYLFKSACARLFKRDFLITNDVHFEEGLSFSEDELFVADVINDNPSYTFFNNDFYYYYLNPTSASRKFNKSYLDKNTKYYELYLNKFSNDSMLMKSIYLEMFTIYLRTRVVICTKSFKLLDAIKFIKSKQIYDSSKYFLEHNDELSASNVKLAKFIYNKHFLISYIYIIILVIRNKRKHD